MNEKTLNIFMDRTFDASCMKRIGENELASQIINRLKANYPKETQTIDKYYQFYLSQPNAEYIEYRTNYMIKNKDRLKLKYK